MNAILRQRLLDAARAILGTLARKLLTIVGTMLVTRGLIDQGSVDGIIPMAIEVLVGGLMTLGATGWGVVRAYLSHTRLAAAWAALTAARTSPPA